VRFRRGGTVAGQSDAGGNPTAASALLRLELLTGREDFRHVAEDTLESFSGIVATLACMRAVMGWRWSDAAGPDAGSRGGIGAASRAAGGDRGGPLRGQQTVTRIAPFRLISGGVPETLGRFCCSTSPVGRRCVGHHLPWADVLAAGHK